MMNIHNHFEGFCCQGENKQTNEAVARRGCRRNFIFRIGDITAFVQLMGKTVPTILPFLHHGCSQESVESRKYKWRCWPRYHIFIVKGGNKQYLGTSAVALIFSGNKKKNYH